MIRGMVKTGYTAYVVSKKDSVGVVRRSEACAEEIGKIVNIAVLSLSISNTNRAE